MAIISLRQLLDHAAEYNYGVAAFNVNNLEQILAIMDAAHKTNSPVILQVSRGARKYAGDLFLKHIFAAAVESYPHIPVVLHQDHGNGFQTCLSAMNLGFSSVMMDGSLMEDGKSPGSFEYNVEITSKVVESAHMLGISVEGELGCLGSLETGQGEKEDGHGFEGTLDTHSLLTDPDEAEAFVKRTGVDALAIAIGTSHGAYKFSRKPDGKILAINRILEINEKIPNVHLVMHGSSSVPSELQQLFREYGGEMPETWGVPIEEIQEGIRHGVRKINVDTDNRIAMTAAMRKLLIEKPSEFDLRNIMKPARAAMEKVCAERMVQFGQAGQASKIKPISLSDMVSYYKKK